MGAWIETQIELNKETIKQSHPSWVRGLKLLMLGLLFVSIRSHPSWVRGLKLLEKTDKLINTVAPLVGAWIETDGLKPISMSYESHPSWVRGLKHPFGVEFQRHF